MGRRRPLMPPPPRLVLFVSLATSVKGMSRADGGADAPLALMAPEKVGMRVMSFNARLDTTQPDGTDGADGSDAWPHRRELLLADITARNPDLLGLQEVLPHMAAWLCERSRRDSSLSLLGLRPGVLRAARAFACSSFSASASSFALFWSLSFRLFSAFAICSFIKSTPSCPSRS